MPDDIVELAERIRQKSLLRPDVRLSDPERFLLDEGLDLLASYRSIGDQTIRTLVAEFVQSVATLRYSE